MTADAVLHTMLYRFPKFARDKKNWKLRVSGLIIFAGVLLIHYVLIQPSVVMGKTRASLR